MKLEHDDCFKFCCQFQLSPLHIGGGSDGGSGGSGSGRCSGNGGSGGEKRTGGCGGCSGGGGGGCAILDALKHSPRHMVGRCGLTASKPVLKAPVVATLDALI